MLAFVSSLYSPLGLRLVGARVLRARRRGSRRAPAPAPAVGSSLGVVPLRWWRAARRRSPGRRRRARPAPGWGAAAITVARRAQGDGGEVSGETKRGALHSSDKMASPSHLRRAVSSSRRSRCWRGAGDRRRSASRSRPPRSRRRSTRSPPPCRLLSPPSRGGVRYRWRQR